jgi:hypothetical protein
MGEMNWSAEQFWRSTSHEFWTCYEYIERKAAKANEAAGG